MNFEVVLGDITVQTVDVVVNAANRWLRGGGGVDGAIHRAAGPELLAACAPLAPCDVGDVRVTRAFRMPARYVVHTVGPVWADGSDGEVESLATCYRKCIQTASDLDVNSLALPCISTGAYGFPIDLAAETAIKAAVSTDADLDFVRFVAYDQRNFEALRSAYDTFVSSP